MWHARFDITCVPLVGSFNQAGRIRLIYFNSHHHSFVRSGYDCVLLPTVARCYVLGFIFRVLSSLIVFVRSPRGLSYLRLFTDFTA